MDDLFKGGLSLQVLESNTKKIISEQEQIRDNVLLTNDERIAAAKKINMQEKYLQKQGWLSKKRNSTPMLMW